VWGTTCICAINPNLCVQSSVQVRIESIRINYYLYLSSYLLASGCAVDPPKGTKPEGGVALPKSSCICIKSLIAFRACCLEGSSHGRVASLLAVSDFCFESKGYGKNVCGKVNARRQEIVSKSSPYHLLIQRTCKYSYATKVAPNCGLLLNTLARLPLKNALGPSSAMILVAQSTIPL
jgi:hypothetical protein